MGVVWWTTAVLCVVLCVAVFECEVALPAMVEFRMPLTLAGALTLAPWWRRYVWIGVGRDWNQVGVMPALNSDAS